MAMFLKYVLGDTLGAPSTPPSCASMAAAIQLVLIARPTNWQDEKSTYPTREVRSSKIPDSIFWFLWLYV
jgi:hypothetical protein